MTEAKLERFDAALLDLDLPGVDGFALARHLRAGGFRAPLIAVTARADAGTEPRARAAGFDDFLRKPVTGAMLAAALVRAFPRIPA
jgi:CheY-like chemotaxis protein